MLRNIQEEEKRKAQGTNAHVLQRQRQRKPPKEITSEDSSAYAHAILRKRHRIPQKDETSEALRYLRHQQKKHLKFNVPTLTTILRQPML